MKKQTFIEPAFLKDTFLNHYFFADVLFSQYCTEEELKTIYDKYAEVFCIQSQEWLDEIWAIVSLDLFRLADNMSDFNRLVRLAKLYPENISAMESYVLSQKAAAIQAKANILNTQEDASFDTILHLLRQKANNGNVDCTVLVAFLEHNGILVDQNTEQAEKRMETAAKWNSFFGTIMGCHYSKSKEFYIQKFRALLNAPFVQPIWEYLKTPLCISDDIKPDRISLALEHAFCQGAFGIETVNYDAIKLMDSCVLSTNAKTKLIKTAKANTAFPCEIPLEVTRNTKLVFDASVFGTPAFEARKAECDQICSNLSMIDLRDTSIYKPLLLVCEDEFVLDYYREAIKGCFSNSPTSLIHLQERGRFNLSHSKDNIFIAAMEKYGKRNIALLLDHCEILNPECSAELADYLKATHRKHYKSGCTPMVEIDLGGVLPILFASTMPDPAIVECCDVVLAAQLTQSEFRQVLERSLENKREIFKLSSISMDPNVSDFLFDYSSATVTGLLNKAIGELKRTSKNIHITVATLQGIIDKFYANKNKNGFWRGSTL